ncbi:hypothetical protein J7D54_12900 [Tessaracoccus sp. MC1865]|uniref:helicase-related protein n=1 Tax=Tessaracoccus sp. MC1865 TaxID=2760310 RepID=UPI001AEA3C56|nr:helicase-related protein [Tessaracoccus sp. MC1865]QTO37305.1 hypothetical protein J7D54_12900 [Tessaracoccus sp. MC1865]
MSAGNDRADVERMLFQAGLSVAPVGGGHILEYDTSRTYDDDAEAQELHLRFRNRQVFAVGHGMAADWIVENGVCERIWLTPVPAFVVSDVETTGFSPGTPEYDSLSLEFLSTIDQDASSVSRALHGFVNGFEGWIGSQESRVAHFGSRSEVASRIVARSRVALERMKESLQRLDEDTLLKRAFALAMSAMRLQMLNGANISGRPQEEPRWRPFQLGFILVSLASTADSRHPDREIVDLIWFPTGGGKTEAYLGLAAIEIFRRRLTDGIKGGGTAVITRYTLRLLTAQQFQRAAALICAMEVMRDTDPRVVGMAPFTIGLWVGNEVTPGTKLEAREAVNRLRKAANPQGSNEFQVESCPWCEAALVPEARSEGQNYGMVIVGHDVIIRCPNAKCHFHGELPLIVIDEQLYEAPPTILLATVDKFARLQFNPMAGRLLGLNSPYRQPSLIIQDELHLLSGPLGTTVAVFDAVIQQLLSQHGHAPKIVASTATIRASADQVRGLYGRDVALYPPSGLDDDVTFFSKPVASGEGRLYVGLMPQSMSQASALISSAAPLLELPDILGQTSLEDKPRRDSYWTLVMYHNSLRELGRSGTLVLDDVNGRLETRAERLSLRERYVRTSNLIELTSRRGPGELPDDLRALSRSIDERPDAVDVVLSSNMLSVGIDVPRLALMLMVGQPKTTAEYIQATSRVGRGGTKGLVTTLFRPNRARDRSHFETFRGYHEALYRGVEPSSVTPWSLSSRDRSLAGAIVTLVRQTVTDLAGPGDAINMDLSDPNLSRRIKALVEELARRITASDPLEAQETESAIWRLLRDWDWRAKKLRGEGSSLRYERLPKDDSALLKRFGQIGEGWLVGDSMRSVEPNVAVRVQEPNEGRRDGTD